MRQLALLMIALVATPVALTVAAPSAEAQIGRIRNSTVGRAVDRATGTRTDSTQRSTEQQPAGQQAPAQQAPAQQRNPAAAAVLEIDASVLERFERAMKREGEVRAAVAVERRDFEAKQQRYGQCVADLMLSSEYQALMQRMEQAMDKEDWDGLRKLQETQQKMLEGKCPAPTDPRHSSTSDFEAQSSEAGEFTARQYGILKERIVPFCNANVAADPNGVHLPGPGKGWSYTGTEAQALRPRCAALMPMLRGLM
jgi:hypothetical protein